MPHETMPLPSVAELYNPVLQALRNLGGEAARSEICDEVVSLLAITDDQLDIPPFGNLQRPKRV